MSKLTIIRGPLASGKSSLGEAISRATGATHFDVEGRKFCADVDELLKDNRDVVVSGIFPNKEEDLAEYLDAARFWNASLEIIEGEEIWKRLEALEAEVRANAEKGENPLVIIAEQFFENGERWTKSFHWNNDERFKEKILLSIGMATATMDIKPIVYVACDAWFRSITPAQEKYEIAEYGRVRKPSEIPLDDRNQAITIFKCNLVDASKHEVKVLVYSKVRGKLERKEDEIDKGTLSGIAGNLPEALAEGYRRIKEKR